MNTLMLAGFVQQSHTLFCFVLLLGALVVSGCALDRVALNSPMATVDSAPEWSDAKLMRSGKYRRAMKCDASADPEQVAVFAADTQEGEQYRRSLATAREARAYLAASGASAIGGTALSLGLAEYGVGDYYRTSILGTLFSLATGTMLGIVATGRGYRAKSEREQAWRNYRNGLNPMVRMCCGSEGVLMPCEALGDTSLSQKRLSPSFSAKWLLLTSRP